MADESNPPEVGDGVVPKQELDDTTSNDPTSSNNFDANIPVELSHAAAEGGEESVLFDTLENGDDAHKLDLEEPAPPNPKPKQTKKASKPKGGSKAKGKSKKKTASSFTAAGVVSAQTEKLLEDAIADAKEEFEQLRNDVLSRVPKEYKGRFGQLGFSKWRSTPLPVLCLSPYGVPPGGVRDQWMAMFQRLESQGRVRDISALVYWYGAADNECYGFVPAKQFVTYEDGVKKGFDKLPPKIAKKIKTGKALTKPEEDLRRGLEEMQEDVEKEPEERKRGIVDFMEGYQMLSMDDVREVIPQADLDGDGELLDDDDAQDDEQEDVPQKTKPPKKKGSKKKNLAQDDDDDDADAGDEEDPNEDVEERGPKKKKSKTGKGKKIKAEATEAEEEATYEDLPEKKQKKKKKKDKDVPPDDEEEEAPVPKKKKKDKDVPPDDGDDEEAAPVPKKKKKRLRGPTPETQEQEKPETQTVDDEPQPRLEDDEPESPKKKKKGKKKKKVKLEEEGVDDMVDDDEAAGADDKPLPEEGDDVLGEQSEPSQSKPADKKKKKKKKQKIKSDLDEDMEETKDQDAIDGNAEDADAGKEDPQPEEEEDGKDMEVEDEDDDANKDEDYDGGDLDDETDVKSKRKRKRGGDSDDEKAGKKRPKKVKPEKAAVSAKDELKMFKKCEKKFRRLIEDWEGFLADSDVEEVERLLDDVSAKVEEFSAPFIEYCNLSDLLKQTKQILKQENKDLTACNELREKCKEVYVKKKKLVPEGFKLPQSMQRKGDKRGTDKKHEKSKASTQEDDDVPIEAKTEDSLGSSRRTSGGADDKADSKQQDAQEGPSISRKDQGAASEGDTKAGAVKAASATRTTAAKPDRKKFMLGKFMNPSNSRESTCHDRQSEGGAKVPGSGNNRNAAARSNQPPLWMKTAVSKEVAEVQDADNERWYALEFLRQMAGYFPEGKEIHEDGLARSLELAIYDWSRKRCPSEEDESTRFVLYWKKVHALVAAICGKRGPSGGPLMNLMLQGQIKNPSKLVELSDDKLVDSFEGRAVVL